MRLQLDLDYALTTQERTLPNGKLVPARMISSNTIFSAVDQKYPTKDGGIKDRLASKAWARIARALNRATESESDSVEISRDGVDFLRVVLEPFCTDTRLVLVKEDILEHLDEIVRTEDAAKNGACKPETAKV